MVWGENASKPRSKRRGRKGCTIYTREERKEKCGGKSQKSGEIERRGGGGGSSAEALGEFTANGWRGSEKVVKPPREGRADKRYVKQTVLPAI